MPAKRKPPLSPITLQTLFEPDSLPLLPHFPFSTLSDEQAFLPTWQQIRGTSSALLPSAPQSILAGLNEPQRLAVTTTTGPLLILAGPGSGKTRVLTCRSAYLLTHQQVSPQQILAMTFTNKAAREMSERVERLVGTKAAREMTISTFHSFCYRLLRKFPEILLHYLIEPTFTIADERAQDHALGEALKHVSIHGLEEGKKKPAALKQRIAQEKNALRSPDTLINEADQQKDAGKMIIGQVYKAYDQHLHAAQHQLDFEDLLFFAVSLLRTVPTARHACQIHWPYLQVDEFQDCNLPQYRILELLGMGTPDDPTVIQNVCVVGDDDQRIYSWRGAGAKSISDFERDFPQVKRVILNQNYRSTQTIVATSQQLIRENAGREEKGLWTLRAQGETIVLITTSDEEEQAKCVAEKIQTLADQRIITSWKQVAVLYRTNAQSQAIEAACLQAGLPYTLYGSIAFFERKEIKDFLCYLRVLLNPFDTASLLRCIGVPARGIGKTSLTVLQAWAEQRGIPFSEAISRSFECPELTAKAQRAFGHFGILIKGLRESVETMDFPDLLDQVLQRTGFAAQFDGRKEEDRDRLENLGELRRVLAQFAGLPTPQALEACLEHISLMSSAEIAQKHEGILLSGEEKEKDTITLLTLHASKGLEFSICFIIGCDEDSLPHSRGNESEESSAEERRLAYVGFSRAMDRLYLTRVLTRDVFGKPTKTKPSRFLASIPPHLLNIEYY